MELVFAAVVGTLFGAGVYMMSRRSMVRLTVGLALLSHAANLLVFAAAGVYRGSPPLIDPESGAPPPVPADPLPQALILTAIVIGFGTLGFFLVLVQRTYQAIGTDDLDRMKSMDGE